MNLGYFHLVLNHLPVLGVVFGLLLFAAALLRNSAELRRAALWVFVLSALAALPAFLTGEPAEDLVKGLPGVTKQVIEAHEDFASVALGAAILLGLAALGALILAERSARLQKQFTLAVLLCSVVAAGLLLRTAQLGGQIRHTEVRPGALAFQEAALPGAQADKDEDHDRHHRD